MNPKLLRTLAALERLSLRERAMVVVGLPLALLVGGQFLLLAPVGARASAAQKDAELKRTELKALEAALAARPAAEAKPEPIDALKRDRDALAARVDEAQATLARVDASAEWGTVVRATATGVAGLVLTQLRTLPAETVNAVPGASAPAKAAAPAGSSASGATVAALPSKTIYVHRADLTVKGEFGAVLDYLQALRRVPGDLRWDRLQLGVAGYPQASVQIQVHTLSDRPETPFN